MIQCPEVCQYESLTYMYSISFTSNQTEGPMTMSQSVNTCTNFTSPIEPSNIVAQYNISLVIVNEANERHTLEKVFSEYILYITTSFYQLFHTCAVPSPISSPTSSSEATPSSSEATPSSSEATLPSVTVTPSPATTGNA